MVPLVVFLCALFALIIAVMQGLGRGNRPPLWVAIAALAFAMMLPWMVSMSIR